MENNLKQWYIATYPTDELGSKLRESLTFQDVHTFLKLGLDVYDLFGVGDSVIRERVFGQLAEIMNVDYNVIYHLWLDN